MKRFNWLLIGLVGLVILCLAMVLYIFLGSVPKSTYEILRAEYDALRVDYDAVSKELIEIKKVYPPQEFASSQELYAWLLLNDVSDRPDAITIEDVFRKALEIQEDALTDGYIISAAIYYCFEGEEFYIWCLALVDGYIWTWDPETDELLNYSDVIGLLRY
jgi:hypothetical protein